MDHAVTFAILAIDPQAPEAANTFAHWLRCFEGYIEVSSSFAKTDKEKLLLLYTRIDQRVFNFIQNATTYQDALNKLKDRYELKINSVYGRHKLATRRHLPGEPFEVFLDSLQTLARACNLPAVTAEEHTQGLVLDALVAGIGPPHIRHLLLAQEDLTLAKAITITKAQLTATHNMEAYAPVHTPYAAPTGGLQAPQTPPTMAAVQGKPGPRCYFCGQEKHPRKHCPAKDCICSACGKKGHYAKVCRSSAASAPGSAACESPTSSPAASWPSAASWAPQTYSPSRHSPCALPWRHHLALPARCPQPPVQR